ncbi:MAG TPA: hypothetical protein VHY33_06445 [Thermoanaerobaculia bacterium]|nr:hypothetical protein [Thermoanaerobaculia bacterium]
MRPIIPDLLTTDLLNHSRGIEDLLRPRADTKIAGEIAPAHGAGAIDEELGGTGDVVSVLARAFVQDAVARNRFGVRIG